VAGVRLELREEDLRVRRQQVVAHRAAAGHDHAELHRQHVGRRPDHLLEHPGVRHHVATAPADRSVGRVAHQRGQRAVTHAFDRPALNARLG
jgi:hypothetical protein